MKYRLVVKNGVVLRCLHGGVDPSPYLLDPHMYSVDCDVSVKPGTSVFEVTFEAESLRTQAIEHYTARRNQKCYEPIEHEVSNAGNPVTVSFKADAISQTDIMRARMQAMVAAPETTKIWISIDGPVTMTATDMIGLDDAINQRRETLVYATEEEWQKIKLMTESELKTYLNSMYAEVPDVP